jgi:hypothetical protein
MRAKRIHAAQMRLLAAFLLLGSVGSFVLGLEMARMVAVVPEYAAQSLAFSGAGITASLSTPLQASGAIGQPTPTKPRPQTKPSSTPPVKHSRSKPVPTGRPVPVVQPGSPIAPGPTTSPPLPCANVRCGPGVKPAPPVQPPPAGAPSASGAAAPIAQCPPAGIMTPAIAATSASYSSLAARAGCLAPKPAVTPPVAPAPAPGALNAANTSPMEGQTQTPAPLASPARVPPPSLVAATDASVAPVTPVAAPAAVAPTLDGPAPAPTLAPSQDCAQDQPSAAEGAASEPEQWRMSALAI